MIGWSLAHVILWHEAQSWWWRCLHRNRDCTLSRPNKLMIGSLVCFIHIWTRARLCLSGARIASRSSVSRTTAGLSRGSFRLASLPHLRLNASARLCHHDINLHMELLLRSNSAVYFYGPILRSTSTVQFCGLLLRSTSVNFCEVLVAMPIIVLIKADYTESGALQDFLKDTFPQGRISVRVSTIRRFLHRG